MTFLYSVSDYTPLKEPKLIRAFTTISGADVYQKKLIFVTKVMSDIKSSGKFTKTKLHTQLH